MSTFALNRFLTPLTQLETLLQKGRYQKDKGIGFYQNKARDVLFRLEALCRIYRTMHDKNFFDQWYKEFKLLEDLLGKMDHYESMNKDFSGIRDLKKSSQTYFGGKFSEYSKNLADVLRNNGWLSGEKINSFKAALEKLKWPDPIEDRKRFGEGMIDELKKLQSKYDNGELDPNDVEQGIHEFRRRIRWVSIYSQAADGMVQLRKQTVIPDQHKKYCTNAIISSPFNKLPAAKKNQPVIYIDSPAFYAVSWIIGHLSALKDTGLRQHGFLELMSHSGKKPADFGKKVFKENPISQETVSPLAELAIDSFIYHDMVIQKITRDILRSIQ